MTEGSESGLAYADPAYVASLTEFGSPLRLPRSRGWLLERLIPGTLRSDLVGPYPLFSCSDWSSLPDDLDAVDDAPVSLVVVVDPIGGADQPTLRRAFPDHVVAMKQHFVRDLEAETNLPAHHRRQLRRAQQAVEIEVSTNPVIHLEDWVGLYGDLSSRHQLSGVRAFSLTSFRQQLHLPGMFAVLARRGGETVSMALWLTGCERGYYHLGASSPAGYEVGASYAVFAAALEHLAERGIRVIDFGGAAGDGQAGEGLIRFKRGWANTERPAYLCGRIFDRAAYAALTHGSGSASNWFPAYRARDLVGTC